MDDTTKQKTLSLIYKNVSNNTNFLIDTFFAEPTSDLALTYFDEDYIEERRLKNKLNVPIEFLSTKINMTKQSIYHTINGQSKPAFEKIVALSTFFEIPINDFMYTDLKKNINNDISYTSTNLTNEYVLNDTTETLISSIDDKLKILSQNELQEVLDFIRNFEKENNEITYK